MARLARSGDAAAASLQRKAVRRNERKTGEASMASLFVAILGASSYTYPESRAHPGTGATDLRACFEPLSF
jgi:hypothetical protein